MDVPGLGGLGMLGRQLKRGARGSTKHHGDVDLPSGHIEHFCSRVEDLIQRKNGEIEGHELHHRPEANHGCPDPKAGETELTDGSVYHPQLSELLQEPFGHLVGSIVLPHFLAQEEHGVVPLHLLG